MAKVELGLKRTCLSCDMRFYDFKRRPIICPGCGTEFDPENLLKGRKRRAAPKSAAKADVSDDADDLDETDFDDEDIDVAVNKEGDDDIDFDEDDVDVDDTDGPGIIQDDITDGDELLPNLDNKDDQQASRLLDVGEYHWFGGGGIKNPSPDENLLALGVAPAIHNLRSVLELHELEPSRCFGDALAIGIVGQTR